jgi:hypothetical protein
MSEDVSKCPACGDFLILVREPLSGWPHLGPARGDLRHDRTLSGLRADMGARPRRRRVAREGLARAPVAPVGRPPRRSSRPAPPARRNPSAPCGRGGHPAMRVKRWPVLTVIGADAETLSKGGASRPGGLNATPQEPAVASYGSSTAQRSPGSRHAAQVGISTVRGGDCESPKSKRPRPHPPANGRGRPR